MSPILNYTTSIKVEKTSAEIVTQLSRRGVERVSTLFNADGLPSGLAFTMTTAFGPREFELPVRAEGVLAAMKADKKVARTQCTPEQASRVAWRIAKDWLEAQIALIDASLATLDEVMFPYMIAGPNGETAFEVYRGRQLEIEGDIGR